MLAYQIDPSPETQSIVAGWTVVLIFLGLLALG